MTAKVLEFIGRHVATKLEDTLSKIRIRAICRECDWKTRSDGDAEEIHTAAFHHHQDTGHDTDVWVHADVVTETFTRTHDR